MKINMKPEPPSFFYNKKPSGNNTLWLFGSCYNKLKKDGFSNLSSNLLFVFFLFPFCLQAQECGSEGFELLIETSLGTGQVCENSTADVSVNVTPESYYTLDQIDSIEWDWYAISPVGSSIPTETTYPPFFPTAQNSHFYDELNDLSCGELEPLITAPPNKMEMFIGTKGFVTCDNGEVETHPIFVGFELLLAPRSNLDISASTICVNETTSFTNTGCFGDMDLSYWTVDGTVIQENGMDIIDYSPDGAGTFEVCLHLVNNCGEDVECKNLTIVPEPDAFFEVPPSLLDGEGCAGDYEFCNTSDTINFYNVEYYWTLYLNGFQEGGIDTLSYKNCFEENFTPGTYELVLTATNFVCDTVQHSFTFTIVESPSVILVDPDPFCSSTFTGYTPDVTYMGTILAYNWTFENGTPATSSEPFPTNILFPPGTHQVTLAVTSACGVNNYQTTVTIDTPADITFSSLEDSYCTGQADTLKITPNPPNGTWSPAVFFNDSCLVIDNLPIGANVFTYTVGTGACSSTKDTTITVIDTTAIVFTPITETFCEDDGIITLGGVTPTGGTWSGIGVVDPIAGTIDPGIIGAGNTSIISYSYSNGNDCESLASKTVTIEGLPQVSLPQDSLFLCDIPGAVNLNLELGIQTLPSGYTDEWIGNCVTPAGFLDPVCLGVGSFMLEYVIFTPNNCTDTTDITILVDSFQVANAGEDLSECVSQGATIVLTGTPTGGTWGGTNISPDGVITINSTMNGDYDYTYTFGGANCENEDVVTVTIINLNDVSASLPSYCETAGTVTLPDGIPSGGTWLYNGNVLSNNQLDISTLGAGNFVLDYEVEATTSNNDTCTNSIPVDLFIDALPNPIIEIPSNLCINVVNTIINNTTEVYTSWTWNFGNGTTATGLTPNFEYSATGNYTITLDIQDTVCQQTFTWDVSVSSPPPPLALELNILSVDSCELLEVAFINQSQVDVNVTDVIYIWNFGNGMVDTTYSVSEAPTNVFYEAYENDTIYPVILSALNSCGEVVPAIDSVYVKPIPISQFSSDFQIYCSGATVNFVNSSVGNPENTIIDLGDGSPLIFDYPFDTLSYQYFVGEEAETFTVQFISINSCGRDTVYNVIEVVPVDVVAAFTVEDNGVFCQNTSFCIEGFATPGTSVWYDMGDGNTLFSNDTCYTYTEEGAYIITQYAIDACGGFDTLQIPVTVLLSPVIELPVINDPCLGDSTYFSIAALSNDVVDVSWDFGDGNGSSEQNPIHVFQAPGTYMVTATATTVESCSTPATAIIQIDELIEVSFLMEDSICANEPVNLENTSGGSGYACTWLIDQTTLIPDCSISTIFDAIGVHNVTLTLTDNTTGCVSEKDSILFVRPTPTAAFDVELLDSCNQNSYRFINLSTNANTVFWDLGDGTSVSLQDSIEHIYAPANTYVATLITSFDGMCFDELSETIAVPETLMSIISINESTGCDLFTPDIQNESTGNNLTYNWSMSNGLSFFEEQIVPSFTTDLPSEEITIQLIVVDELTTCSDTSDITITVFDSPVVSLSPDHVSCNGGTDGEITASVSGGSPAYQYDWSVIGNNNTISDLSAGDFTITVTDSNNCTVSSTIEITQPDPILIELEDLQNATCAGREDGSISVTASGGTTTTGNEFDYEWNIDLPLSQEPQTMVSDLGAGFYIVTVTDELGCMEMAEFTIEDGYALAVVDTTLGISCEDRIDGQIQIAAVENGFPNFLVLLDGPKSDTINSDAGIFSFKDLPEGNYQLTIIDQNSCTFEEAYLVPSWQDPEVSIFTEKETLYRCDSSLIVANGIGSNLSYEWFPQVHFLCLNDVCDSVKVSPDNDITYDLTVVDERGCTATDEVSFTIDEDRTLYVPTAFTPNGDGNNDIFRIRVGEHQEFLLEEIASFNVLDRWGNVLFKAENFHPYHNPEIGWDGKIEGVEAPNDMYVYMAELQFCDGDAKVIKGSVQLIR